MVDIKQADAFLQVARRDLTALRGMSDDSVFADEIFGFHAQQSIEKCLKAWLCLLGLTYPFSHDLNRLLSLLAGAGIQVDSLAWVDEFTVFAHQARYEFGFLDGDALLDRPAIIVKTQSLWDQVGSEIANLRSDHK